MPKESHQNPYEATSNVGNLPTERPKAPSPRWRWLAVPFFAIGGAALTAIVAFLLVEVLIAGDFTQRIAIGFAFIGLFVGGVIGSIAGVGFARGTYSR